MPICVPELRKSSRIQVSTDVQTAKRQTARRLHAWCQEQRDTFLLRFWISLDVDILGMEHFGKLWTCWKMMESYEQKEWTWWTHVENDENDEMILSWWIYVEFYRIWSFFDLVPLVTRSWTAVKSPLATLQWLRVTEAVRDWRSGWV
jgi:hypothetical protein